MKAVLSLSGGLDSTSLLLKLLNEGYEVRTISFDYGQRHSIELKRVHSIISELKKKYPSLTHEVIDVKDVFRGSHSALTSNDIEVPKEEYNTNNLKKTIVPIRNVIFATIIYSKALQWVYESGDKVSIALGVHKNDTAVYPDTRKESVEAVANALRISDDNGYMVDYLYPFVDMTKGELLEEVIDLPGAHRILSYTHSCYDPIGEEPCGKCATCRDRIEAFKYIGETDPALLGPSEFSEL